MLDVLIKFQKFKNKWEKRVRFDDVKHVTVGKKILIDLTKKTIKALARIITKLHSLTIAVVQSQFKEWFS